MDTSYDNAAFSQKFTVRFLGSMEVKKDRGIHTGSQGGRGSNNILIYHYFVCVYGLCCCFSSDGREGI